MAAPAAPEGPFPIAAAICAQSTIPATRAAAQAAFMRTMCSKPVQTQLQIGWRCATAPAAVV